MRFHPARVLNRITRYNDVLTRNMHFASSVQLPSVVESEGGVKTMVLDDFDPSKAVTVAAHEALEELNESPDLCIFHASCDDATLQKVPSLLADALGPNCLLMGAAAPLGFIGTGSEFQGLPGVSVLVGSLPDVKLATLATSEPALPSIQWQEASGQQAEGDWGPISTLPEELTPHLVLLATPEFTLPPWLHLLDLALPFATKVGGVVPGQQLYCGGRWSSASACGLLLMGNVEVDALVSQGCVPVGDPLRITGCQGNFITELNGLLVKEAIHKEANLDLGGQPAGTFVAGIGVEADATEKRRLDSPRWSHEGLGRYLCRSIMKLGEAGLALPMSPGQLHQGQEFQFHVFGAEHAKEQLAAQARRYLQHSLDSMAVSTDVATSLALDDAPRPRGALMATCTGRGHNLFGLECDVETGILHSAWGSVPLSGFFAGGEIGPVGDRTYVHTFASTLALFRPRY